MTSQDSIIDQLDFSSCWLEQLRVDGDNISVTVRGVELQQPGKTPKKVDAILIFEGVTSSKRVVVEYSNAEGAFKKEYTITDVPFTQDDKDIKRFHFSGMSEELNAFISWDIFSGTARLEDIKEHQLDSGILEEHPSTDYFDFSSSRIGKPIIDETSIRLPVSNFIALGGHPDSPNSRVFEDCLIIYEGVTSSMRNVYEYKEQFTGGFKPKYEIVDGPFMKGHERSYSHLIEAVSKELNAWVHWEIIASSVHIEEVDQ